MQDTGRLISINELLTHLEATWDLLWEGRCQFFMAAWVRAARTASPSSDIFEKVRRTGDQVTKAGYGDINSLSRA